MKSIIEAFENSAVPEWNKEGNWVKIENKINGKKRTFWKLILLALLGLSLFGGGFGLSYLLIKGPNILPSRTHEIIIYDTVQILALQHDTVFISKKELIYQRDTFYAFYESKEELAPLAKIDILAQEEKIKAGLRDTKADTVPEPALASPQIGKRTSKPYATNVFFDDSSSVNRSEFRIFHRIEGKNPSIIPNRYFVHYK